MSSARKIFRWNTNSALITMLVLAFFRAPGLEAQLKFFPADHKFIQYAGRIDFSNRAVPKFWQPGVYISLSFTGRQCNVLINDEMLWGTNHNYLAIVLDGVVFRTQTTGRKDTLTFLTSADTRVHHLTILKNTEANIGYLEFAGIECESLVEPPARPYRRIEFIGNSITCGASSDTSSVPCGKGVWHDQHNAYLSYGAVTARELAAQFHLSSVSGIGLMKSCCNMDIIMPQVFDKVSMRSNSIQWDFSKYQPDVVTICLGQNDGIQDAAAFRDNYISFLTRLRGYYPSAHFICLTSPMADEKLAKFMKQALEKVVSSMNANGDRAVSYYFFKKRYVGGCDWHPSVEEHKEIAVELTDYIRQKMKW